MDDTFRAVQETVKESRCLKVLTSPPWLIHTLHAADRELILKIQSGRKFAHATTAELSWHVQNCDLILSLFPIWEQDTILENLDYELIFSVMDDLGMPFSLSLLEYHGVPLKHGHFFQNTHKRDNVFHLWGWVIWCLLYVISKIFLLLCIAVLCIIRFVNEDHPQCLLSLVVKLGTINLLPIQVTKWNPFYKQWNVKKNNNLKNKLTQKLCDENIWHLKISKVKVVI